MHRVWSNIITTDVFPECLDELTVHLLHVRMPAHSAHDAFHIGKQLKLSTIFPTARDERVRSSLLGRIKSCERVLTFKSFHADMVLLEACYHPLRQLWPKDGCNLRQACESSFENKVGNFEARYLDIWLHSIRNRPRFARLEETGLKRVGGHTTPAFPEAAVADFAAFVASRGFSSEMVEVLRSRGQHIERKNRADVPILSAAHHEIRLQDRCGRPAKALFDSHWGQLTRLNVVARYDAPVDRDATPFAVARNFVRCLFKLEQPCEVPRTDVLLDIKQVAGVSRPPSLTLNRPGRSSILTHPKLSISNLEMDVDTKAISQINEAETMHSSSCENAGVYWKSTVSGSRPTSLQTRDGAKMYGDVGETQAAKRRQSPSPEKSKAMTSSGIKKNRTRSRIIKQPYGKGLHDLRLVEEHCPKKVVVKTILN